MSDRLVGIWVWLEFGLLSNLRVSRAGGFLGRVMVGGMEKFWSI